MFWKFYLIFIIYTYQRLNQWYFLSFWSSQLSHLYMYFRFLSTNAGSRQMLVQLESESKTAKESEFWYNSFKLCANADFKRTRIAYTSSILELRFEHFCFCSFLVAFLGFFNNYFSTSNNVLSLWITIQMLSN